MENETRIIPMLAKTFDTGKNSEKIEYPCYVQPKLDGVRMIWDGHKYYSRAGKPLTIPKAMENELKENFSGIPLDGELIIPGKTFDVISGTVRTLKKRVKNLIYNVFDKISIKIQKKRTRNLKDLFLNSNKLKYIKRIKNDLANSEPEIRHLMIDYCNLGYEGIIIRNLDGIYEHKRSFQLQKLKPWLYKIVLVSGYTPGKGKYYGMIGAYTITTLASQKDLGKVGTGLTDNMRSISYAEKLIGKAIRIKYKEETKNGKFRDPVFLRKV